MLNQPIDVARFEARGRTFARVRKTLLIVYGLAVVALIVWAASKARREGVAIVADQAAVVAAERALREVVAAEGARIPPLLAQARETRRMIAQAEAVARAPDAASRDAAAWRFEVMLTTAFDRLTKNVPGEATKQAAQLAVVDEIAGAMDRVSAARERYVEKLRALRERRASFFGKLADMFGWAPGVS